MSKNLMLLLAILIKVFILTLIPSINSDLGYYFDLAKQMVSGLMPYVDFKFEYPPLAIFPIWIPGIFKADREGYILLYRFLFCCCDISFLIFFHQKFANHSFYKRFLIFYSIISLLLAPLLYDRLDLLFGFMLFGCLYFTRMKGVFWTLLGIPYKLITAIFLPFWALSFVKNKDFNRKDFFRWCLLPMGLLLGTFCILFNFKFLNFLGWCKKSCVN